jgi:hypothetical protein
MDGDDCSSPSFHSTSSTVRNFKSLPDAGAEKMGERDIKFHQLAGGEGLYRARDAGDNQPMAADLSPIVMYAWPSGKASSMRARNPASAWLVKSCCLVVSPLISALMVSMPAVMISDSYRALAACFSMPEPWCMIC